MRKHIKFGDEVSLIGSTEKFHVDDIWSWGVMDKHGRKFLWEEIEKRR